MKYCEGSFVSFNCLNQVRLLTIYPNIILPPSFPWQLGVWLQL